MIEGAIGNANSQSLERAPAVLVLRPTRYPGPADKDAWSRTGLVAQNIRLSGVLSFAYEYPWWRRVVLPADAPQGNYDLLLTLRDNSRDRLRQEIKRQFGLVAHRESRMTDVLLLEVDPANVRRIKSSEVGSSTVDLPTSWRAAGVRKLALTNQPVSFLARVLENNLGVPVFDRTGLSGNYDLMIEWPGQNNAESEEKVIRQAVADQLGLRLVPGREAADLLVVERAPK